MRWGAFTYGRQAPMTESDFPKLGSDLIVFAGYIISPAGLNGGTRTRDPLLPRQARYLAALHLVIVGMRIVIFARIGKTPIDKHLFNFILQFTIVSPVDVRHTFWIGVWIFVTLRVINDHTATVKEILEDIDDLSNKLRKI